MPSDQILVTGGGGVVGAAAVEALCAAGFDPVVLARHPASAKPGNYLCADLLDLAQLVRVIGEAGTFRAVVHLAAVAHGQRPPPGETARSVNVRMVANLLTAIRSPSTHWIFASSVAVYGEAGRGPEFPLGTDLRPATGYGQGKVDAERVFLRNTTHADILRLAPVFSSKHLKDVAKRAHFPGTRLRMRLDPSPKHSLCRVERVAAELVYLIRRGPDGHWIHQIAEATPFLQSDLVDWFTGPVLKVPVMCMVPILWLARCVPGKNGYGIRSLWTKLFASTVYPPGKVRPKS